MAHNKTFDRNARLEPEERALLVARVLQRRAWSECAAMLGASGRADVIRALGRIVRRWADEWGEGDELSR